MSVELRPLGVACNIACQYCYQQPQRDSQVTPTYDLEVMKSAVEKEGGPFVLFGGEPLLIPVADLHDLFAWGLSKYGGSSIQSNGVLITPEHIEMFVKYKVSVGISCDGPGELNDARWAGSLQRTREATQKTETAIELLIRQGMPPSIITTLTKANASEERLSRLHDWFVYLDNRGVASARLHLLEVDSAFVRAKYTLEPIENIRVLLSFADLRSELKHLQLDIFGDIRGLLIADDHNATCVWRACDPYTTSAVRGVEGDGRRSNCGRTNKEGIDFVKASTPGFERYVALYHTPQESGGCQGCRFFMFCKGQCPGTAIDGDWRNRTEHCEIWKTLFETIETELRKEGIGPLSRDPNLKSLESQMLRYWESGSNPSLKECLATMRRQQVSARSQ